MLCERSSPLLQKFIQIAFGLLLGCSEDAATTTFSERGPTGGGGNGGSAMSDAGSTTSGTGGVGGSAGSAGSVGGGGGVDGSGGSSGNASGGVSATCPTDVLAKCSPEVSDGHTHTLVVPAVTINAGKDVVLYTAEDSTGHSHELEFTATDFLILKDGGVVIKDECGQGPHRFTAMCPTSPNPMVPNCQ
jgi:hypothetical protein